MQCTYSNLVAMLRVQPLELERVGGQLEAADERRLRAATRCVREHCMRRSAVPVEAQVRVQRCALQTLVVQRVMKQRRVRTRLARERRRRGAQHRTRVGRQLLLLLRHLLHVECDVIRRRCRCVRRGRLLFYAARSSRSDCAAVARSCSRVRDAFALRSG